MDTLITEYLAYKKLRYVVSKTDGVRISLGLILYRVLELTEF